MYIFIQILGFFGQVTTHHFELLFTICVILDVYDFIQVWAIQWIFIHPFGEYKPESIRFSMRGRHLLYAQKILGIGVQG